MNPQNKNIVELLYKEETFAIIGAAMEVYNQLGPGFLEAVYQDALAIEMRQRRIPFQEQQGINITYKGHPLRHKYIPDFIAYGKIIIEIKAIRKLGPIEETQILNYLTATNLRLGLLISFGHPTDLKWKREVR
jgi:GxxExxY protein